MTELVVSPAARLPVGRQVEVQLARAVQEGRLPPGARLPSTRRLAGHLPVHRNTVAATYRRLARRGLVRLARGARARVAGGPGPASRTGGGDEPSAMATGGVAVVAGPPGSRELAVHELEAALGGVSVTGFDTPARLAESGGGRERLAVVESGQMTEARRILAPPTATASGAGRPSNPKPVSASPPAPVAGLLPLLHARLSSFRELVTNARLMDVVIVLTVAPALRRALRETAAALRGDEVAVLTPDPRDREAVADGLRCATVTCADALARRALTSMEPVEPRPPRRGGTGPVHPLRLVSRRTVRELRAMVGARRSAEGRSS